MNLLCAEPVHSAHYWVAQGKANILIKSCISNRIKGSALHCQLPDIEGGVCGRQTLLPEVLSAPSALHEDAETQTAFF